MKTHASKILASTKWLPLLLLLALPAVAQAQYYYTNSYGIWQYTPNNAPVTITGFTLTDSNVVVIPDTINGYSVTTIGNDAFYNQATLTGVIIPNSVTSIGNQTFIYCSGLKSVTIGTNVTSIGYGAFTDCSGLTSVTIPDSVTSIGAVAFTECSGLTNVTIGNSVTSIGNETFEFCSGLTSVTIPNSVISISAGAFIECSGLHQAYFQGNAPSVNGGAGSADTTVFNGESGTAYYLPGTTNWGSTFGGWPTMELASLPSSPQIGGGSVGVQLGNFGFTITGSSNQVVVIDASTNLMSWQPIQTNTLTGTSYNFTDSKWTNYPNRFYRVMGQ
jgi:hypothetical protein